MASFPNEENPSTLMEMVPISVHHSLPEFEHIKIEGILVGWLLTWNELIRLFDEDISLDPRKYKFIGENNKIIDVNEKINQYVNTFSRKQKLYTVRLTRVGEEMNTSGEDGGGDFSMPSYSGTSRTSTKRLMPVKRPKTFASDVPHRKKLLDEEKDRGGINLLEQIAHLVVAQPNSNPIGMKRQDHPQRKIDSKRSSIGSRTEAPVSTASSKEGQDMLMTCFGFEATDDDIDHRHKQMLSNTPLGRNRQSVDSHRTSTSKSDNLRKRKKNKSPSKPVTPRTSRSTRETDSNIESSDSSEDEDSPTREQRKLLKRYVVKYLTEKVSPRSFLRIRSELASVREQDKYFKVTSLLPLTAGMMEQAFCRKTPDINQIKTRLVGVIHSRGRGHIYFSQSQTKTKVYRCKVDRHKKNEFFLEP